MENRPVSGGSSLLKLEARDVGLAYFRPDRKNAPITVAIKHLNMGIRAGEFVCIVGPSGCGKSTFLNAVSGLLPINAGQLLLDARPIKGPGPDRAQVFQSPYLLPWRSVRSNVMYGMESQRVAKHEMRERADHYINLVGLANFAQHYPHELSGGMQQRVNLARALAIKAELLLLDEPFAALDAQTRELMQAELLSIWRGTPTTALFVTHQINEAVYLADRVLVFSGRPGRVREEITIDLPRPRELRLKRTPQFLAYEEQIWQLIESDVKQGIESVVA
jgi:NitT/TauT family transport system ATP-binding protein